MIFRAVEDADLIRKARRGDVEAFNLLISRWEKRVFNYLLRILQNREPLGTLTGRQIWPLGAMPRAVAAAGR